MTCPDGVEGVHEDCCLHDLRPGDEGAFAEKECGPGQVCCWCGDLYLDRHDPKEHGEHRPK